MHIQGLISLLENFFLQGKDMSLEVKMRKLGGSEEEEELWSPEEAGVNKMSIRRTP